MAFNRDAFNEEVGLRLQLRRKRRGLTQAEVADALEMPRSTYANMERGKQRVPVDVVWRVAVLLGISTDDLLPRVRTGGEVEAESNVDVSVSPASGQETDLETDFLSGFDTG